MRYLPIPRADGRGVPGWAPNWESVSVVLLAAFVSVVAYGVFRFLGVPGLIMLCAGILGASGALALAWRSPVLAFAGWLAFNSEAGTIGMVPMPGLPDLSILRILMLLVVFLMIVGAFMGRNPMRGSIVPDIFLILHTVYILFNAVFIADHPNVHMWYVSTLGPALAYFFAKQYYVRQEDLRSVLYFFVLMTVYYWFVSFAEHFKILFLIYPRSIIRAMNTGWAGRSRGPFNQPAVFGQVLGMYLLVHFFFLARNFKKNIRVAVAVNAALASVGLLFTYTRGGWVATVAGFIVMAAMRPAYRKMFVAFAVGGVLLGSIGIVQMAQQNDMLQERVGNTRTIEARVGVVMVELQAIRANPLFGVGHFSFRDKSHQYNSGGYVPGFGYIKRSTGDHGSIHEMYIGRTAEEGLLGMSLWFGFMAAVAWQLLKRWRDNPQGEYFNRDFLAMVAGVCVAYLVGGLAFNYRFFSLVNIMPYFLAGLVVGFPRRNENARIGSEQWQGQGS